MAVSRALLSSGSDEYSTPQWLFDQLNREFGFSLDPCSSNENAKCPLHYTIDENGLEFDWRGQTVFMNPPYSAVSDWMRKASHEALHATVVCLVPARTDTIWWHDYAMQGEIRLIKGRLKFGDSKNSAPFPSAVIVLGHGVKSGRCFPLERELPTGDNGNG